MIHVVQNENWELSIFFKIYDIIMILIWKQDINVLLEEDV